MTPTEAHEHARRAGCDQRGAEREPETVRQAVVGLTSREITTAGPIFVDSENGRR
jgi:hypothetical protein